MDPPIIEVGASPPRPGVRIGAPPAPWVPFGPTGVVPWETSERDARARAQRAELPLIVWARADWATPTLEMERRIWTDPRVVKAARGFVALHLDLTRAEGDAELYAQRYELTAIPMTLIFDGRGRRVASFLGFADVETLVDALGEAAP